MDGAAETAGDKEFRGFEFPFKTGVNLAGGVRISRDRRANQGPRTQQHRHEPWGVEQGFDIDPDALLLVVARPATALRPARRLALRPKPNCAKALTGANPANKTSIAANLATMGPSLEKALILDR